MDNLPTSPAAQEPEKDFFDRSNQPYYMTGPGAQQPLPNESTIVTMGHLSLVLCAFGAAIGLIMGIIVTAMAAKAMSTYKASPTLYRADSLKKVKGALTRGIIAMCFLPVVILIVVVVIFVLD